jgi:hypothetical protein
MLVSIWVEPYYIEVDVPIVDIAEILAERYNISGEAMLKIIYDYDLDLTEDLENNTDIQDLAYDIYRKELENEMYF